MFRVELGNVIDFVTVAVHVDDKQTNLFDGFHIAVTSLYGKLARSRRGNHIPVVISELP